LDDKNPFTLSIISNLAELYAKQGSYEQAEPLLKDTLTLRKEVLGEKHPDTLTSMNNLAMLYYGYEQSESLLKDTLALRTEVLGKTHPDTLITMSNLALLYKDQEHYKEALFLIRQVNDYYKNTLPKLVDDKANTALISQTNSKGSFIFHIGLIDDLQKQPN
jgi:tetratricopeptide (TPR) repeat protein